MVAKKIKNMSENIKLFILGNRTLSLLSVLGFLANLVSLLRVDQFFWDLNVYQTAVNLFNNGRDPYLDLEGLKFVYSPYVLMLFSGFGEHLTLLFYAFYALIFLLFALSYRGIELLVASLIATPLFMERFLTYAMSTGNLTSFAHFLIITLVSFNLPTLSLVAICLLTIVKPYFGAYFLLVLVVWRKHHWTRIKTLVAFIITVIVFISQMFVYPDLFDNFVTSLSTQALGDNAVRDVGIGIYRIAAEFLNSGFAIVTHFVVWSVLAVSLLFIFRSLKDRLDGAVFEKLVFYTCLIVLTLSNPRMKVYDYWIIPAASLVLLYVLNKNFRFLNTKLKKTVLVAFACLVTVFCSTLTGFYADIAGVYVPAFVAYALLCYSAAARISTRHDGLPN